MKVTILQCQLHWEDREKNLKQFESLIKSIREETELIILPEMFTTGFSMNPKKVVEPANGPTLKWMQQMAREKNAVLCGSVAVKDRENYFNRLFWVEPGGEFKTYNKRHLFRMGQEDQHYKAGAKKLITKWNDWSFCPLICYDLRFPVWSRNKFKSEVKSEKLKEGTWDYDVLIYVANWPEVRTYAWKQLLIARAIENQCYVIGVNRVGKDGNGVNHSGESMVIDPKGEILNSLKTGEVCVETIELNLETLMEYRNKFPLGLDADNFNL